jgi:hypothetical protein
MTEPAAQALVALEERPTQLAEAPLPPIPTDDPVPTLVEAPPPPPPPEPARTSTLETMPERPALARRKTQPEFLAPEPSVSSPLFASVKAAPTERRGRWWLGALFAAVILATGAVAWQRDVLGLRARPPAPPPHAVAPPVAPLPPPAPEPAPAPVIEAKHEPVEPPPPAAKSQPPRRAEAGKLQRAGYRMLERGDVEGALTSFRKAIALNPVGALSYRGLGAAYSAKGSTHEAAKAYRKYLALSPHAQDAAEVRALVQQLQ